MLLYIVGIVIIVAFRMPGISLVADLPSDQCIFYCLKGRKKLVFCHRSGREVLSASSQITLSLIFKFRIQLGSIHLTKIVYFILGTLVFNNIQQTGLQYR